MPLFHFHEEKLKCPYRGCGKTFERPAVLTDSSTLPRENYYACPFCQSKIDLQIEDMKIVNIKANEYPGVVLDSPAKCPRHFGFLNTSPTDAPLPDECLACPKVLQCTVRKK